MPKSNESSGGSAAQSLIVRSMEEVMHDSMIPYAEYVILDRAIPRVEDGLKPVQRRILYTMMELGLSPDKPHRKSARIVGDCLGKYHPHGDSSVYDAMVRMAQDFNMMAPLVDGHGNFGSVDGDPAAAMRYTEARMTSLALELLRDIDKDTVNFSLNFDDTMKEPDVLPGRFPNLLVNGATGIAVGLATNIPPHNLAETIDATVTLLDNPDAPLKRILKHIKGPDFPTGGYLLESQGLEQAYTTGRGRVTMRAKTHFEPLKNGKTLIVIDELPYQVNKAHALEKILKLSEEKKALFSGISDIRDESDRNGTRAVVELKKGVDADKVLQYLFKYSDLQLNFGINMVAIAEGKPQQLGLIDVLRHYIRHQKEVVTRRTRFDLAAAERRAHILEGLIIAIDAIDKVIKLIRGSKSTSEAKQKLMDAFKLDEVQSQAILDMRLQRLVGLQIIELKREYAELLARIETYRAILADETKLIAVIKEELLEIRKKYKQPRRTQLLDEAPEIAIDESELVAPEDVVVFLTDSGVKRLSDKVYAAKGSQEEGRTHFAIACKSNQRLQFFTNLGNMFAIDASEIPEPKGKERGIIPSGLFAGWQDGERILSVFCFDAVKAGARDADPSLFFFTRSGLVKRTPLSQYETRNRRIAAAKVKDGDELIAITLDNGLPSVLLISKKGMSIRFPADTVPENGRVAAGVKGMQLDRTDTVIFAAQLEEEGELLLISDRGYAKRSLLVDYESQSRNGKGLKTFDFKKNGANGSAIVAAYHVKEPIRLTIVQAQGQKTAIDSEEVPIEGRFSKGRAIVMALIDDIVTETFLA